MAIKKGKKVYLVIGSNNFWYGINDSLAEAKEEAKDVAGGIGGYGDEESGHTPETPGTVYIYQAFEVARIEKSDESEDN